MRAREFIIKANRVPLISLRYLNKLKKDQQARRASHVRNQQRVAIMYANPAKELEQIELEKARVELAQEKAELAVARAELERANREALARMAASEIEIRHDNRGKIGKMALSGVGRRKKP